MFCSVVHHFDHSWSVFVSTCTRPRTPLAGTAIDLLLALLQSDKFDVLSLTRNYRPRIVCLNAAPNPVPSKTALKRSQDALRFGPASPGRSRYESRVSLRFHIRTSPSGQYLTTRVRYAPCTVCGVSTFFSVRRIMVRTPSSAIGICTALS